MKSIGTKQVLGYMLLPALLPRLKVLLGDGFSHVAYFIAVLYRMVGLIPASHPYLRGSNVGRYGVFDVVSEAANHLKLRRENIDQIIIFLLILVGLVVLSVQVVLLIASIFMPIAQAAPLAGMLYFTDPRSAADLANDISFVLLDRVFGVPGIFNSCVTVAGQACREIGMATVDAGNNASPTHLVEWDDGTMGTAGLGAHGFFYSLTDFIPSTTTLSVAAHPTTFHVALHGLFRLYSMGILVIAMMILLYYVVAVVIETAQTGTPFGRRFNGVWAPIRFVFALGLLIPIAATGTAPATSVGGTSAGGLNAAQYITLYAAKFGSTFATNAWFVFMNSLQCVQYSTDVTVGGAAKNPVCTASTMPVANAQGARNYSGSPTVLGVSDNLVTLPAAPDIRSLIEFNMLAKACYYDSLCNLDAGSLDTSAAVASRCPWMAGNMGFYEGAAAAGPGAVPKVIPASPVHCGTDPGAIRTPAGAIEADKQCGVMPYLARNTTINRYRYFMHTPYHNATVAGAGGPMNAIDFYEKKDIAIRYGVRDQAHKKHTGDVLPLCGEIRLMTSDLGEAGAKYIRHRYYGLLQNMWQETTNTDTNEAFSMDDFARRYVYNALNAPAETDKNHQKSATSEEKNVLYKYWHDRYVLAIKEGQIVQRHAGNFRIPQVVLRRGWAGAGIWYNRLAEVNGALVTAARRTGDIVSRPTVMEKVYVEKSKIEEKIPTEERYNPEGASASFKLSTADDKSATLYYKVYSDWRYDVAADIAGNKKTNNAVIDVISTLFGVSGLFDMRENADTHPLTQLVAIGKSLVESAIVMLAFGFVGGMVEPGIADIGISIATIGLTAGFVLYYVLPFMPFLYFYFAVGGWVKAIFEAMVGVPLWALAHMRIDGDGLPGEAGLSGYMLIFEIFLRPVMILFGLVASMNIFAAMVFVLNDIFDLLVANLAGADAKAVADATTGAATPESASLLQNVRGSVDQFFYTVIYAIIVYMIGMSCFKMVDMVPQQILRWMGQSVSAFGENQTDVAGQLTQYAAIGGMQVVGKLGNAVKAGQGAARSGMEAAAASGAGGAKP